MDKRKFVRAIISGFISVHIANIVGYWLPSIRLPRIDFASIMFSFPTAAMYEENIAREMLFVWGIFQHFINSMILALFYAWILFPRLPGPRWLRGIIVGLGLWLISMFILSPIVFKAGLFAYELSGLAWLSSLIFHLVYGVLLGIIYYPASNGG
jgi:hypothetical protein